MIYKMPDCETKLAPFSLKIDAEGTFEGYASLFGKKDMGNDIIQPGAFRESLKRRGTSVKMLYQHDPNEPLGVWRELKEDRIGLRVKGQLTLDVTRSREVYSLMKSGALDGLSIGFHVIKGKRNPKSGIRYLHKIDLWEISIVTFPMLTEARISAIKARKSSLKTLMRQAAYTMRNTTPPPENILRTL